MNKKFYIVMITAALILSTVPLMRFVHQDVILPGKGSYYHLNAAEHIQKSNLPEDYIFNPFHYLLAYLGTVLSLSLSAAILPFLLGMLSLIIFYALLSNLGFKDQQKTIIAALIVISPAFIYMFTIINPYSLSMFLLLLAFYMYTREDAFSRLISFLIMTGTAFYSIMNLAITVSFLIYMNRKTKRFYSLAVIIPAIINYVRIFSMRGFPNIPEPSFNMIFELGNPIGYSTFAFLLFIPGLYIVWKKQKQITGYSLFLVMLIISFYLSSTTMFLNIILTIVASYALVALIKRDWALSTVKKATFTILFIGLLFPAPVQVMSLANSSPSRDIISSLEWLKNNSGNSSTILSETSNSFWIQTVAKRKTVLDNNQFFQPKSEEIKKDINTIFYSRNLEKTRNLLMQYQIDYIYITLEMRENTVWKEPQQGILFLFRNKETFEKVYSKNGIEIWKIDTNQKESSDS